MPDTLNDILLNWKGSLIPDMRGETERVAELMDRKLSEGISIDSAVEIISAGGYPIETVKRVAEARRREIIAANTPKPSDPEYIPVIPRSYADVATHIRRLVMAMPAEDVLNLLSGRTKSSPSLIRLTEKERKQFRSIVAMAKTNDDMGTYAEIDRWVGPHIETAIVDTEILAKRLAENEQTRVEEVGDGTYVVEDANGLRSAVDMSSMSCTCSRYVFGSFAHTGLACEHILCVRAALGGDSNVRIAQFDDDEDMPDEEYESCPQCGGPGTLLGKMGRLTHLRCRDCGWDYSVEPDEQFERTEMQDAIGPGKHSLKDLFLGVDPKQPVDNRGKAGELSRLMNEMRGR